MFNCHYCGRRDAIHYGQYGKWICKSCIRKILDGIIKP